MGKIHYIFDVNTNSILRVNHNTYLLIEKLLQGVTCSDSEVEKQIEELLRKGYLKPNDENVKVEHPALPMVEQYLEGNVRLTFSALNENGSKNEIEYSDAFDINYRYELFKCYLKCIGRLDKRYVSMDFLSTDR